MALEEAAAAAATPLAKEQVFESKHPYNNNESWRQTITLKGAPSLAVFFDKECRTEKDYDELKFYTKDPDESDGSAKDTFFKWSGKSAPPMLQVPSNTFCADFTSDGSNTEWVMLTVI